MTGCYSSPHIRLQTVVIEGLSTMDSEFNSNLLDAMLFNASEEMFQNARIEASRINSES
jgi:hypothetical protein